MLSSMQNGAKLDNIWFTVGKLRNLYVSVTAANYHCYLRDAPSNTTTATTQINKTKSDITKGIHQMSLYSKEFRLMDYDIVGFDLDCTLLRYDLNNMVLLEYELLKAYLVREKNYPKSLLHREFDSEFLQKGLIIDIERGNILKLSQEGTILKAAHGTRFMSGNEISEVYGESRKWDVAIDYIRDPLSAWNGPIAEKLRTLLDYFDIGASLVFAQAVDILDEISPTGYKLLKNDYKIWPNMLEGLLKIYSRENFVTGESAYFEALKENPDKYLLKSDNKVIKLLHQLRASGKALYLLTGSNIDFANFTASYALGPQWRELFDNTIGFAKKPGFFYAQRQFLDIANLSEVEGSEISLNDELKPNTCYSQGNWQQLKKSLCKNILKKDPNQVRSLYVGDNLIQDIYTPNTVASIDTLALSEELLENDNNYDFKNIVQSTLWGSYFSVAGTPTLWAKIIEKHSQLCVSHIDIVAQVPIQQEIKQTRDLLIR